MHMRVRRLAAHMRERSPTMHMRERSPTMHMRVRSPTMHVRVRGAVSTHPIVFSSSSFNFSIDDARTCSLISLVWSERTSTLQAFCVCTCVRACVHVCVYMCVHVCVRRRRLMIRRETASGGNIKKGMEDTCRGDEATSGESLGR